MALDDAADNLRDMQSASEDLNMNLQEAIGLFSEIEGIQQRINQSKGKGNKLTISDVKELKNSVKSHAANLSTAQKTLETRSKELQQKSKSEGLTRKEQKELEKVLSEQSKISDEINFQGGKIDKINQELSKTSGLAGSISKGFGSLGKNLEGVKTPLDKMPNLAEMISKFIGFAWNAAMGLDESLGKTAKSMNISYGAAEKQRLAIQGSVEEADHLFIRIQDVVDVSNNLNSVLGTNVVFQDMGKALQNDIKLISKFQKISGLSAKEGEAILKYSLGTGQEATKLTKEIMGAYRLQGLKGKLVLNEKDAMKEIANTSARMQLSIKGGASGLGEALASSKALGVSLGQVESIAGSLLNFEDSITNELNAELLLGRDINLEKARQAALDNHMATLAQEIQKQVGSATDFANLNRIQQEAIASAMGMQANELAESLLKQEELKSISEDAALSEQEKYERMLEEGATREEIEANLGEQALASIEEQASMKEMVQAKEQEMQEQIQKELLGNMKSFSDALTDIFKMFDKIFGLVGGMKTVMVAIGALLTGKMLMGLGQMVAKLGVALGLSSAKAVAEMTAMSAMTLGLGAVAAIGGIMAVTGVMNSEKDKAMQEGQAAATQTGDLAYDPKGGPVVISPNEGGIFQGTKNDQVAMGPNTINQAKNQGGMVASVDMSQTNTLLQELINAVTAGGDVILDGNKVGQALNIGARKLQ